jgi:K+:H+ antiporter
MPNEFPLLADLLVLLLASVPIAFICHRLRLPVMVGFMVTGVRAEADQRSTRH